MSETHLSFARITQVAVCGQRAASMQAGETAEGLLGPSDGGLDERR